MKTDSQTTEPVFWKSAGFHLVSVNADGWLNVTADLLRAYYTRPEIHPVEESCADEHRLFEMLMADPFVTISAEDIKTIKDEAARQNYQIILDYRDFLVDHGSIEAAYAALFKTGTQITIPPLFIDQLTHLIMRNVMDGCEDPMQLRAAEIFFRDQKVTTEDGQLMFADSEILDLRQKDGGLGGLGALIAESGTPLRDVSLDILSEENKHTYFERSDRFDTAIDFRFTEPANDAFARVIEKWVSHFFKIRTRVQPLQSIKDETWRWHIGLDATATAYLNGLYEGEIDFDPTTTRIAGLFSLIFLNKNDADTAVGDKPVYLGLAVNAQNEVKLKPQNLLTNLPIRARDS
ncbi:MAG: DUF6352 family protein [Hyphomicrobiales bacterium]